MKYAVIAMEDNAVKLVEMKNHERDVRPLIQEKASDLHDLLKEITMKILAYMKCSYDDYVAVNWLGTVKNASFSLGKVGESVQSIQFRKGEIIITFANHFAPDMKAMMKDDVVLLKQNTSDDGIFALMNDWKEVKGELQKLIDGCYTRRKGKLNQDLSKKMYQLEVARNFKI